MNGPERPREGGGGGSASPPARWGRLVGFSLMALAVVLWALAAVVVFLPLSGGQKAWAVPALLVGGEVFFWVSAALLGRELFRRYRRYLDPRRLFRKEDR